MPFELINEKDRVRCVMKVKGVRVYGKADLRMEEFELPPVREDEILVRPVTDSVCMSTNKLVMMGQENDRAHKDMGNHPCIIGHEFCGRILEVGDRWKEVYKPGDMFIIQPALNSLGIPDSPGFTFPYCGGNATLAIMPHEVMETGNLITCALPAYYMGSLAEPLSTVCCAINAFFHTTPGYYEYLPGIAENSRMAVLAGAGPMGLAAVSYALHNEKRNPKLLVVTDIDEERLRRAARVFPPEKYAARGITLLFVNTGSMKDPVRELRQLSRQGIQEKNSTAGDGFDDILVMAPTEPLLVQADEILAVNGCLNFFAGPRDTGLRAPVNYFRVHYDSTHIIGTKGGTDRDMREVADLMTRGVLDPSPLITHIGGLPAVRETVLNLSQIPGGKKMIYAHLDLPLMALDELEQQEDPRLRRLGEMVRDNDGVWSPDCEHYLLQAFAAE